MTQPRISVTGGRELRRALKEVEDGTKELKVLHKRIGKMVADKAKGNVPVRSGALRRTIRPSARAVGARVSAGGSVPYAGPIEFGWPSRPNKSKGWRGGPIAPRKFLLGALDSLEGQIHQEYAAEIDKLVTKAGL